MKVLLFLLIITGVYCTYDCSLCDHGACTFEKVGRATNYTSIVCECFEGYMGLNCNVPLNETNPDDPGVVEKEEKIIEQEEELIKEELDVISMLIGVGIGFGIVSIIIAGWIAIKRLVKKKEIVKVNSVYKEMSGL